MVFNVAVADLERCDNRQNTEEEFYRPVHQSGGRPRSPRHFQTSLTSPKYFRSGSNLHMKLCVGAVSSAQSFTLGHNPRTQFYQNQCNINRLFSVQFCWQQP